MKPPILDNPDNLDISPSKCESHSLQQGNGKVPVGSGASPSFGWEGNGGNQHGRVELDHPSTSSPLPCGAEPITVVPKASTCTVEKQYPTTSIASPQKRKRSPSKKRGSREAADSPKRAATDQCSAASDVWDAAVPPSSPDCQEEEEVPQGDWGARLPLEVLYVVFAEVTRSGGAVPALVRLSRVCRLWRAAALSPHLWRAVDLGTFVKERRKTETRLRWLLQHRLTHVRELSLAGWHKAMTATCLSAVCSGCPELRSLSLARCRRVSPELLLLVARRAPRLRALDLSAVEPRSSVSVQTLRQLTEVLGPRLAELTLAHNMLSGLQQVITVLADGCPGLEVLDLSNMTVSSGRDAALPVERLMLGCPRLRVLCWTNTAIRLAPEPDDQAAAPGFPALEELSVGVLKDSGRGVDDADLWRLLCSSARLRLLDVRGCTAVTAAGLLRLPADHLQHLFLSRCGAAAGTQALWPLLERWRHSLLELDLAGGGHQPTVDGALRELAAPETERWPPPPLRRLDLCGAAGSLQAVQLVVAACPRLRELDLTSCRALPRGLKRLYRGDEVATLRDGERRRGRAGRSRPVAGGWGLVD